MNNHELGWKSYLSRRYLAAKRQEKGILWCLRTGTFKLFQDTFRQMCPYLLAIPSSLLYLLGVRFLPIRHLYSIGHLAIEPDCYVKEGFLGMRQHYVAIILAPVDKVANRCLLEYWRQYIRIITSPILYSLLYPLCRQKILQYDISTYTMDDEGTALCYEINARWAGRPPLLSLRKSHQQRGWDSLRKLGLLKNAWFVCIHCREPANRPQDTAHTYRDVDIHTYFSAMQIIVKHGGWCIRMGDSAMKPLPPMKNVIDYAHHSIRSDWMDVFLCANCRFFLGCSSGLPGLPHAFGVPCALANLDPVSLFSVGHNDIAIPKLIWSSSKKRHLTFEEVLHPPMGTFYRSDLYGNVDIEVVDNSPEDIRNLAIEMLDFTEGNMTYTAEDQCLQELLKSLLKPGNYAYGAASRIGRDFLRKYARLLPSPDETTR